MDENSLTIAIDQEFGEPSGLFANGFKEHCPEKGLWLAIYFDAIHGAQVNNREDIHWLYFDNREYIGSRRWIENRLFNGTDIRKLMQNKKFRWNRRLAYISLAAHWGISTTQK